jgi:hypothetical protein
MTALVYGYLLQKLTLVTEFNSNNSLWFKDLILNTIVTSNLCPLASLSTINVEYFVYL